MQVMEAIKARRSIRRFTDQPVEREKILALLEAMRLAPSAGNRQKWRFYAVTSEEKRAALAEASGNSWWRNAPLVLAVTCDDCGVMINGHRSDTIDCSIALSFAMLAAEELGLGTCWLASYREEDARPVLGLAEGESVTALLLAGYPDEQPDPRPRLELDKVAVIV